MLSREEIAEIRKAAPGVDTLVSALLPHMKLNIAQRVRATRILASIGELCELALAGIDANAAPNLRSLADIGLWLESNPAATSVTILRSLAESLVRPVAVERKTGGM